MQMMKRFLIALMAFLAIGGLFGPVRLVPFGRARRSEAARPAVAVN